MITPQDKELLAKKGISEEQIAEQLACFEKGFPYLKLFAAASVGQGILAPDADEQKKYLDAWETYTQTDKTVVKFVPASGAASRMFKNLFEFLGADYDAPRCFFHYYISYILLFNQYLFFIKTYIREDQTVVRLHFDFISTINIGNCT